VCNRSTGECLDEGEVIYVDKDDDDCASDGGGTREAPFCVLQDAVDEAKNTVRDAILVEAPDSATDYYESVDLIDAGTVGIVARGEVRVAATNGGGSAIYLTSGTVLSVDGLELFNQAQGGKGVSCAGSASEPSVLSLRNSFVHDNAQVGIEAYECTLLLDGNTVTGNSDGGVWIKQSAFTVTNNLIANNGDSLSSFGGVMIDTPGDPQVFQYNTVAANLGNYGVCGGVQCVHPVEIRNSIVYGNDNDELDSNCTPHYCLIEDDSGATGSNNIRGQSPSFVTTSFGDYRIEDNPPSPCIDAADPGSTVDHDIDGQSRPLGGGYDIGADEAG